MKNEQLICCRFVSTVMVSRKAGRWRVCRTLIVTLSITHITALIQSILLPITLFATLHCDLRLSRVFKLVLPHETQAIILIDLHSKSSPCLCLARLMDSCWYHGCHSFPWILRFVFLTLSKFSWVSANFNSTGKTMNGHN